MEEKYLFPTLSTDFNSNNGLKGMIKLVKNLFFLEKNLILKEAFKFCFNFKETF